MTSSYVVITGFMGCGKTEVAASLAEKLQLPLIDLDDEIHCVEGRSAAQLIVQDGERIFREIETSTLRKILEREKEGVIALGGGAWIEEVNREIIKNAKVITVWLDVPFDVCWKRISASEEDRPLGRTLVQARDRYEKRRPIYGLATISMSPGTDESVDSISSRIRSALEEISSQQPRTEV